jgi:hypothetical protein
VNLFRFIPGYESGIYDAGREPALMMWLGFMFAFLGTRFYTRMARARRWGSGSVGGVHLHHLVPGVVMSLLAGALMVATRPDGVWLEILAIVFGAGSALILDEFAMLLHLHDVYWTRDGRSSIEACLLAASILGLAILATSPTDEGGGHWGAVVYLVLLGLVVVISMLKGKVKLGLVGIIFPLFALVGAIRLAKPESIWARKLYPERGRRMRRARAREEKRAATWTSRRNRFYDLVGGAPSLDSERETS